MAPPYILKPQAYCIHDRFRQREILLMLVNSGGNGSAVDFGDASEYSGSVAVVKSMGNLQQRSVSRDSQKHLLDYQYQRVHGSRHFGVIASTGGLDDSLVDFVRRFADFWQS